MYSIPKKKKYVHGTCDGLAKYYNNWKWCIWEYIDIDKSKANGKQ